MEIDMSTRYATQKEKLIGLLKAKMYYRGMTSKQARSRGIGNVSARIWELRHEDGYKIYSNPIVRGGHVGVKYRLDNSHR